MNKKSFTLIEVIIAISLFMILIFFLYKSIEQTKFSNTKFKDKQETLKTENWLNSIFLEDIAEQTSDNIESSLDKDKNSIIQFTSNNNFHNLYYNNITYLINSQNQLVRIESKNKFNKVKINEDFFNTSYIDVLLNNIVFFQANLDENNQLIIILKQKDKKRKIFKLFNINTK